MSILHINSSLFGDQGQSSLLADKLASKLSEQQNAQVVYRNVSDGSINHLSAETFAAFTQEASDNTAQQQASLGLSNTLIKELNDASHIVLAVPFYNFFAPSQFKAWFDHVARVGVTFNYTENGPKGALLGKKVYVVATRGGKYAGSEYDHQTPWLKQALGFIGLDDVQFIFAEGLAMGDYKDEAISNAASEIDALVA